jgi:hypothetical protein
VGHKSGIFFAFFEMDRRWGAIVLGMLLTSARSDFASALEILRMLIAIILICS